VPVQPFEVSLAVELGAAGLGGLQGALAAAVPGRRVDVLGAVVIGLVTALGGSLLRDLVLDEPPVVVWVDRYLVAATLGAVAGLVAHSLAVRAEWLVTALDAVVLGVFGAIGASKALSLGVGPVGALVVGVLGAIGGGVVRDVLLDRPVSFLHVGTLYAVASATGVTALIVLLRLEVPVGTAGSVAVVVAASVRLAAVRYDWTFPEPRASRSSLDE
jgi:uncharacterized membrane protein YeiH